MTRTNSGVDDFLRKAKKWQAEMTALRRLALDAGLDEAVKWRLPCYSYHGHNVVIIQPFKDYCALMFFKGALLRDPKRVLWRVGRHMQAPRQLRFTSAREIAQAAPTIRAYVREAVAVEKAGLKVKLKTTAEVSVPDELETRLKADRALKAAFGALTPGRQRAYIYYVASAKRPATREARVEKCVPRIREGRGLDDAAPSRKV